MQTSDIRKQSNVHAHVFTSNKDVNVTFTEGHQERFENQEMKEHVSPRTNFKYKINPAFELIGNQKVRMEVQLWSGGRNPFSVVGMNSIQGSCDAFLAFPTNTLGTDYFVLTHFQSSYKSQFALAATQMNTRITITLPANYKRTIDSERHINMIMNNNEVIQMQDQADLSGTRVTSNKPIALFSGGKPTVMSRDEPNSSGSGLVEQLPPIQNWGQIFHLIPVSNMVSQYLVKIVSSVDYTVVKWYINDKINTFTLTRAGDFQQIEVSPIMFLTIESFQPILVIQTFQNGNDNPLAMTVIPPVDRYKSFYVVTTLFDDAPPQTTYNPYQDKSNSQYFLLVVANHSDVPRLMMDGKIITQDSWRAFPQPNDHLFGNAIKISNGRHEIGHLDGNFFGMIVYGQSVDCAYAYPAGMIFGSQNKVRIVL